MKNKRKNKYLVIPISLWETDQLSWLEKIAMIEIDSRSADNHGAVLSITKIASIMGMTKAQAKDLLAHLYQVGAIDIAIDNDGNQRYRAFVEKDSFSFISEDTSAIANITEEKNIDSIDYAYVLSEWKRINPTLLQPRCFTPKMQQQLRNLLKNNKSDLSDLIKTFKIISTSRFLMGANDHGWKATLQWLISDSKGCFQKILMGGFSNSSYAEKESYKAIMESSDDTEVDNNTNNYYK